MSTFPPGSLEAECPGGLDWAWYGLGECIRTTRDVVSIVFGIMSIISWVIFGLPQIIENCRKKIPDSAVSIFLLIFWVLGDSLNFIGTFLTNQLFLQKLLAGYTVFIDIVLFSQYVYYKHRNKKLREVEELEEYSIEEKSDSSEKMKTKGKVILTALFGVTGVGILSVSTGQPSMVAVSSGYGTRRLLQLRESSDPFDNFLPTVGEKIGYAFGWISFVMYACGRSHQIYLNWRRKSTEGLSIFLFVLAALGNTFYACQIFIRSIDAYFVVKSLPWILGSLGMLIFDFIIFSQFWRYKNNKSENMEKDAEFFSEEESSL
nr:PQ loop repeat containing protein 2 [Hymenolepis microstoma]